MAAKKPRKIKDLKARLGKTIAPDTKGGAAVTPPNLGGAPADAPGGVVPPAISSPPGPGGVDAPPFMDEGAPAASAPVAAPAAAADPFAPAAASAAAPQAMRFVVDGQEVDDIESGQQKKSKAPLLIGIGIILGLIVGGGVGSVNGTRRIHNMAIRDGKAVYESISESSSRLAEVQRLVNEAATAIRPAAGTAPAVNYEAIEALQALENPFTANVFSRKSYSLYEPAVVDNLFEYYGDVQDIWARIERLSALTSGEERRTELNNSATAATEMASTLFGCAPKVAENRFVCNLGVLTPPSEGNEAWQVRASRTARRNVERQLFTGGELTPDNATNFVLLVNTAESTGVLGEPASLFADVAQQIQQLKALVDETVEAQGRLDASVGQIASQSEVTAL